MGQPPDFDFVLALTKADMRIQYVQVEAWEVVDVWAVVELLENMIL